MQINNHWETIRKIFQDAFETSTHYSIATVGEDGTPYNIPIGSLILRENKTGFYFEEFLNNMTKNLEHNQRVCVLAVNSGKLFWSKSLLRGKFKMPPAVRLMGTVSKKREATEEEIKLWHELVKYARKLKGYTLLWKNMKYVRDIHFDSFEPVNCGVMTSGLWQD